MKQQLFIPDKIKVGFQERSDTYTGKLAYIVYYDKKGVLRKETSWQQWRDKNIEPLEFDNCPTEGFVLNKGVGGVRQSYGWNPRNEYIRVYDPRGFEFEISVANLLFILRECDCSRGKGLEGKMVYAMDGTSLLLLPVGSQEYTASCGYSELQGKSIAAKDLIPGATYLTKKQQEVIYLGRLDAFNPEFSMYRNSQPKPKKKVHVFVENGGFRLYTSMNSLSVCVNQSAVSNFAELMDQYYKSVNGSPVVKLELGDIADGRPYYRAVKATEGFALVDRFSRYHSDAQKHQHEYRTSAFVQLLDGHVDIRCYYTAVSIPGEVNQCLYATLASGSVFQVTPCGLASL